jgi:hypothetical protein
MFHRGESTIRYTCGTVVAAVVMMAATSVAGPGFSLQQISVPGGGGIGPIPWGNGGTYEGPGDTVPPGIGEHTMGMCGMQLPPVVCDATAQCDLGWQWTADSERCVWPRFRPGVGLPLLAQGFMLRPDTVIEMLQSGAACLDGFGNITVCVESPFEAHEVHVFQSASINGYSSDAAIDDAVSTAVCIDDELVLAGWSFEELAQARPCDYPTVCITFRAECMIEALRDWADAGVRPDGWGNSWFFYVDFVSCTPCD